MQRDEPWKSTDPKLIAEGLRDGTISLSVTDAALRTPIVNAYIREVQQALADKFERQETFAAMAQLLIDERDEHRKTMRKLSGLDKQD